MDLLHVAGQSPPADIGRADAERAQLPGELLLVPRSRFQDAERPGEGRAQRHVCGQEGDHRVDFPRTDLAGQLLNQAGPGDRRARIEQERSWRGYRNRRARRRDQRVTSRQAGREPARLAGAGRWGSPGGLHRAEHSCPAPRGGQRRRPEQRLLQALADREELDFPAGRDKLVGKAWSCLDPDCGDPACQAQAEVKRRLTMPGAQPPAGLPARRIDEHGIDAGQHQVADVGADSGSSACSAAAFGAAAQGASAGAAVRGGVDRCVMQGKLQASEIGVHRDHAPASGERTEISSDAAAQVSYHGGAGVAGRAVPGGDLGGCLLQARPGEQHRVGAAELGPGQDTQCLLSQRGGDKVRRVAAPQRLG